MTPNAPFRDAASTGIERLLARGPADKPAVHKRVDPVSTVEESPVNRNQATEEPDAHESD